MIAVQIKAFPLAGLLSKFMAHDLAELSLNLTKPNIQSVENLVDWLPETVKETAPD